MLFYMPFRLVYNGMVVAKSQFYIKVVALPLMNYSLLGLLRNVSDEL